MLVGVRLYSNEKGEINKFLSKFYDTNLDIEQELKWTKEYINPIEISDIIGAFVDNKEKFKIKMWICLDKDIFIKITESNADEIIRYLFERFPY